MSEQEKDLSKADMTAYERWELPAFGGGGSQAAASAGFAVSAKTAAKPPTAGELEAIRKAAYQEGLEQGKRDGYKVGIEQGLKSGTAKGRAEGFETGKAEGQAQIDQVIKSLAGVMTELADPVSLQQQQITQALTNIAIAVARSVIHRELHTDSSIIVELISKTLADLPKTDADVTVFINAADQQYAQEALKQSGLSINVVPSREIHPGGCRVSTSTQLIDFTVEKRFQKTIHEMFMKRPAASDTGGLAESPSVVQEQSDYAPSVLDEVVADAAQVADEAEKERDSNAQSDAVADGDTTVDAQEGGDSDSTNAAKDLDS